MDENRNRNNLVVGGMLVALGVLFFVALFFQQNLSMLDWGNLWPLTIVTVGVLFFVGMIIGGRTTSGLAIPGSIIVTVGLILWAQNVFNIFETWSYAWALIIVAVGVGQVIMGKWGNMPSAVTGGLGVMRVGAVLFLVFGAMMEIIFSLTGVSDRQMSIIFPAGLVLLGVALLVSRVPRVLRGGDEPGGRDLNLFWPVFFLGLGLIWTLGSLNLFPQTQVMAMLNLWPVLLVAIGLDVMLGRRNPLVGGLIALVLVAGLFAFVAFANPAVLSASLPFLYGQGSVGGPQQLLVGEGDFVTQERSVAGFNRVELTGAGTVEVVQGEREGLTINAQQNLLPYIESRVVGNRLVIGPKPGYELKPAGGVILYRLTVKNLNELDLNGAGEVSITALQTGKLNLNINGSGSISLTELQADSLSLDINGSGRVTAGGTLQTLEVDVNGVGNFNGENLQAQKVSTNISGSGQLVVWAVKSLDVSVSGSGTVGYYGSPQVEADGHGTVNQLGEK